MLVVIVIIGILASLITVAAVAALDKAHQTQIKLEMDQIASAFERYKNQYGSYPPNVFVAPDRKDKNGILNPLKRHFKKAFPRQKREDLEPLIAMLTDTPKSNITPAEAINFWLGGFSSDPEFPLTGPGGPIISPRNTVDASLSRTSLFEFDEKRLTPTRRRKLTNNPETAIQLFSYHPPKLTQPFVYFDTSRTPPLNYSGANPVVPPSGQSTVLWPAYLDPATGSVLIRPYVHLGKTRTRPVDWVNPKKFQIISTGTDDEWGGEFLAGTKITDIQIIYPVGPYTDPLTAHADNLVNFSPKTLEDSQP